MVHIVNNIKFFIFFLMLFCATHSEAQNIKVVLQSNQKIITEGNYAKALEILQGIKMDSLALDQFEKDLYNSQMATCLYFENKYSEAIPYLKNWLAKQEGENHTDCNYLETFYAIGTCYKHTGNYEMAEKYLRKVMIEGEFLPFRCTITSNALNDLIDVYQNLGYTEFADKCIEKIQTEIITTANDHWQEKVDELYELIDAYEQQGKYKEACETFDVILKVIETAKGKINYDYLFYSQLKGMECMQKYKMINEALAAFMETIEVGRVLKTYHPEVANSYVDALQILANQGKYDDVRNLLPEAKEYYNNTNGDKRTITSFEEHVGTEFCVGGFDDYGIEFLSKPNVPTTIRSFGLLGDYYRKRDNSKAIQYFKRAEDLVSKTPGVNDFTRRSIFESLMYLHVNEENYTEAIWYGNLCRKYIQDQEDINYYARHELNIALYLTRNHNFEESSKRFASIKALFPCLDTDTQISIISNEGYSLILAGEYDSAILVLEEGIETSKKLVGEENRWLAIMYHNLGRSYMLKEDFEKALTKFEIAVDYQLKNNGQVSERTALYIQECKEKIK